MSFGSDLDERIQLLRGIWLFSTCDDDELARIAAVAKPREADVGTDLGLARLRDRCDARELVVVAGAEQPDATQELDAFVEVTAEAHGDERAERPRTP